METPTGGGRASGRCGAAAGARAWPPKRPRPAPRPARPTVPARRGLATTGSGAGSAGASSSTPPTETSAERIVVAAPRVLGLTLLEDREQRRGDEDRRVRAGADSDEEREREVLERVAAEEPQRRDRDERDERRCQRARDRLPQGDVADDAERRPLHQRDVLADAVEDDDRVVDRVAEHGQHGGDRGGRHLPPEQRVDADGDQRRRARGRRAPGPRTSTGSAARCSRRSEGARR